MRLFGCSGINITGENGATSALWVATQPDSSVIDPKILYHSEMSLFGMKSVKEIPIEFSLDDESEATRLLVEIEILRRSFKSSVR